MKVKSVQAATFVLLGAWCLFVSAAERPERAVYPFKTAITSGGTYRNGDTVGTDFVVSGTITSPLAFTSDVPYRVTLDGATVSAPVTLDGDVTLWLKGVNTVSTPEAAALESTGTLTIGGTGSVTLSSSPVKKTTGVINAREMTVAGGSLSVVLNSQVKNTCGIVVKGDYTQMAGDVSIDATCCATNKVQGLLVNTKAKSVTVTGGTLSVSVDGPKSIGISLDKATTAMTLAGGVVTLTVAGDGAKGIKSDKDDGLFSMSGGILNASVTGGVVYENVEAGDGTNYVVTVSSTTLLSKRGTYVVQDASPAYAVKVANIAISGGTVRVNATGVASRGLCADGDGGMFDISGGYFDITCSGNASNTILELLDENALTTDLDKSTACGLRTSETNSVFTLTGGTLNLVASGKGGKCLVAKGSLVVGTEGQTTLPSDSVFLPDIQTATYGEQIYVAAEKQKNYRSVGTATTATDISSCYFASNCIVSASGESADYSNPKCIKAEGNLTMHGGRIRGFSQAEGGEGFESKTVLTINGGVFEATCYDDCINAGSSLIINGGYLYCGSTHNDCIDSNGSASDAVVINGGLVLCFTAQTPECGIDADTSRGLQFNGGTIVSFGSATDMAYGSSGSLKTYRSTSFSASNYLGKYLKMTGGSKTVYVKVPSCTASRLSLVCTTDGCTASAPSVTYATSPSGTSQDFHGVYFQ